MISLLLPFFFLVCGVGWGFLGFFRGVIIIIICLFVSGVLFSKMFNIQIHPFSSLEV